MSDNVFSRLYAIDVSGRIEKKNGLSYLSWAWAWQEVLKVDPQATWVVHTYGPETQREPCMRVGQSAMVHVSVTINGLARECMLPVMDHRNKAIQNPDARQVSDAIMRCMVKAVAMHGLGLFIYAGEDLPEAGPPTAEERAAQEAKEKRQQELTNFALDLIHAHKEGRMISAIQAWYDADVWAKDHDEAQEEKLFVWGLLKDESALRSAIKANKIEQPAVKA